MIEPENYDKLTRAERKKLRERYVEDQRGKCYHCHEALDGKPLNSILKTSPPLAPFTHSESD